MVHQSDPRDQIEAALRWLQTREALLKRIAALQARIGRLRVKKNGKTQAAQVRRARPLTVPKRNR
jgi:hypothetical protein